MSEPKPKVKPAGKKKPRNWRRRGIIALIAFICIALIFRAGLSLLLPTVMNRIAKGYKLQCNYSRLDLSILGGNAAIWDLDVTPQEGGDPILHADYCQGDISVIQLLKGKLVVYRAAADGVDFDVERNANGHIPLLDRFVTTAAAPAANSLPSPTPSAASSPAPMTLQPPLRIDALRLAHIRARFHDASVKPEMDARAALDLRLSDLGNPDRPARFDLEFSSDPVLDTLRINGRIERDGGGIHSDLDVLLRGLHLKPAQGYLTSLGLRAAADDISASMTGKFTASLAPNPQDGIQATLSLNDARVTSDGKEAAALDHLTLDIQSLNPGSARLGTLLIDGVRCNVERQSDGSLVAAGIELLKTPPPAPAQQPPMETAAVTAPVAVAPAIPAPATPAAFRWSLQQVSLKNFHAGFDDEAVSPPTVLALDLPKLQVDDLVCDPDHPDHVTNISANLTSPGIVRDIRIVGQAVPFSTNRTFKLTVAGDGISPVALEPYLNAAGLSSEWKNGTFSVAVDGAVSIDDAGKLTADANLADFRLANGDDLLDLKSARIKGASVDPQTRTVRADSIEVSGPGLWLARDTDGNLRVLGFKTKHPSVSPPVAAAASPTMSSTPVVASKPHSHSHRGAIDNFEIGHFAWKDVQVSLTDSVVTPATTLEISDAGITVDDLAIHLRPGNFAAKEGKIHAWLVAPNLASRISLDGTITPTPDQTTAVFDVHGEGINADVLSPYLKASGIEPVLKDGEFQLHGHAQLNHAAGMNKFSLACTGLKYADGSRTLASADGIKLDGLGIASNGISLDGFELDSPRARVERLADGTLEAGGLHFVAKPPAPPAPSASPTVDVSPPATQPAIVVAPAPASTFGASVKSVKITNAGFDWNDHAVQPEVQTGLHLNADVSDFVFGSGSKPAALHVMASADDCLDAANVDGTIAASATDQSARLNIDASGLRAGVLAAYLPPNIKAIVKEGTFHSIIVASASQNPAGGRAVDLSVNDLNYGDAGEADSLLKFDSFHVGASRFDPDGKRIALDDITLKGLETNIRKTSGGIELLGIELTSGKQSPAAPVAAPVVQTSDPPAAIPATSEPTVQNVFQQFAAERNRLPYVTLAKLDLNVGRISIADQTRAGAKPLVVSDLQVRNNSPIQWLGKDPESNPVTDIEVTGKLEPVADAFDLNAKTVPFSRQKTLTMDLTLSGIHGQGLVDLNPKLAAKVDPQGLQQGQFRTSLTATLKLQTARPTSFDLSYGGKLDFSLKDTAFRQDPASPVLAGVGEIHSEGVTLAPNLQGVEVRELEIDNLIGRAERKQDGMHLLGLVVREHPTSQPPVAAQPKVAEQTIAPDPVKADPPSGPAPEFKVDRLLVSGMDFHLEDQTADPPLVVPINGLDVEAQGLSTRAMHEEMPIRFNILANAAKVDLPSRQKGEPSNRDLFAQVSCDGIVTVYPKLKGWTKASVNGFELLSVRGIAEQEKVKLGGGIFDGDINLRFPGDGSIDTSTRLVLTDLSVSEPSDGFIRKKLKLPAPLDFVIVALQDQDGSITVPLNVQVQNGKIGSGAIVAASVGALTELITTAVASAPLKVTSLFGLGGNKNGREQPVVLSFPTGYSALQAGQIAKLRVLSKRLADDKSLQVTLRSDAGSGDVELAGQRVNPGPDDALTLAGALSRRREALLAARLDAASQVRALLASTDTEDAAGAIQRLRTINRELFDTENAMDHAYDLLRPGADRQAMRRTRAATLSLSRARLDAVRQILLGSGKDVVAPDRIRSGNSQFVESPDNQGGTVTITIIKTK